MANQMVRQIKLAGYGLQYGDASDDISAYMDETIRELRWAYYTGGAKIAVNPDNLVKYATDGVYDNSTLDSIEANYARIGAYISQLDNRLRQGVLTGVNPTSGSPYTLAQWQSFAQDVASDITSMTQFAWDSSYIAEAPSSAKMAAQQTAATIANPLSWPWYAQLAAVGGILYIVSPLLSIGKTIHSALEVK